MGRPKSGTSTKKPAAAKSNECNVAAKKKKTRTSKKKEVEVSVSESVSECVPTPKQKTPTPKCGTPKKMDPPVKALFGGDYQAVDNVIAVNRVKKQNKDGKTYYKYYASCTKKDFTKKDTGKPLVMPSILSAERAEEVLAHYGLPGYTELSAKPKVKPGTPKRHRDIDDKEKAEKIIRNKFNACERRCRRSRSLLIDTYNKHHEEWDLPKTPKRKSSKKRVVSEKAPKNKASASRKKAAAKSNECAVAAAKKRGRPSGSKDSQPRKPRAKKCSGK